MDALRVLAAMPFLDRLELAAVAGVSEGTAHNALSHLHGDGLVGYVRHAAPLNASTRRWHVTAEGLHRLAAEQGTSLRRLLRTHPVTAHWQRLLLARLDAVAVIYRLVSAVGVPHRFRWYRSAALDAAMSLADGKTIGIIRQGATTDRTAFADRVRWLPNTQQALPRALLALMPDEVRLRQARKLLARYPGPVFLALERDIANSEADDRIWRITSNDAVLSLDEAIAHMRPGGRLLAEPPLTRLALPQDPSIPEEAEETPGHLLPTVLKPAEKGVLDRLADWPWIVGEDLSGVTGLSPSRTSTLCLHLTRLGLVSRISLQGRRRLAPQPPGVDPPGPPRPGLRFQGGPALERRGRRGQRCGRLAERPRIAQPPTGPHHRAHRSGASLHGGSRQPGERHPRLSRVPGQPAPPCRPATSVTGAGCAPSTPTPSAWCELRTGPTPSSWNGSAGPRIPPPWPPASPHTYATTPPTSPWTTTDTGPLCWWSSTTPWPRPTSSA